jgi:hypothetical protein
MIGYSALELGQELVREGLAQARIVHTTTSNCTPIEGWEKEDEDFLRGACPTCGRESGPGITDGGICEVCDAPWQRHGYDTRTEYLRDLELDGDHEGQPAHVRPTRARR